MDTRSWYVLRTKPHKETQVFQQLQAHHIETFFPTINVKPINPRSSKIRPYFPGYMFLNLELDIADTHTILWLPGSIGLLEFDGVAATVSQEMIDSIRQRIIALSAQTPFDDLKPGDPVHITGGILAGYEALFDLRLNGTDRVRILVDLLGRLTKAEVNIAMIAKKRPVSSKN